MAEAPVCLRADGPKDLAMATEALEEDKGYATHMRDQIQRRRRQRIDDGPKESTTTTEALEEEDEHEDYNNDNGCVGGG